MNKVSSQETPRHYVGVFFALRGFSFPKLSAIIIANNCSIYYTGRLFMEKDTEVIPLEDGDIKRRIFTIRGRQVMLDSDLAELYGYEVKNLNRQVKRNIR